MTVERLARLSLLGIHQSFLEELIKDVLGQPRRLLLAYFLLLMKPNNSSVIHLFVIKIQLFTTKTP